jgi:hypothetical protein
MERSALSIEGLRQWSQVAFTVIGPQFRAVLISILALCLYSRALPSMVFVYWVMFLVAVAGALVLFRFILLIEQVVAPDMKQKRIEALLAHAAA